MNFQNFSMHDWMNIGLAVVLAVLICIFVIQLKRLGKPDERSTAMRSYMIAVVFISLLGSIIMAALVAPEIFAYRILTPAIISIGIGIAAGKLYEQHHVL